MLGMMKRISLIVVLTVLAICLGAGFSFAIEWTPNFSSSTHTLSQSSTNTDVTVNWDAMTPTGGQTADTYTYVWDNTSDTEIAATKTPTETISGNLSGLTVTRTLSDDTWYLHMRAVDSGATWTTTEHFGPIIIDSTPAPTVTNIEPASGVNSRDTANVTITGTNFKKLDDSDFTSVTAKIGSTALSNVTVASSTSITATYAIKDKTAGAYDVTVITDWGTSEPLTDGFTVTNPAPTVTSISPTSASNAAEKSVTITGTGFLSTETTPPGTANPTVEMKDPDNSDNNFNLTSVTVVSTTSITATVSAGKTAGTYDVKVTNSDGQSDTKANVFEVTLPAPTITSVSPGSGTNDNATTITIVGTNFATSGGTPQVTLEATGKDTIACTSEAVTDATQMTAVVPASQVIGTYTVKVTNPDAQFATKATAFTVSNPVATVTSITPSSMTNDSTQSVTIVGTNFRSGLTVKIDTTECTGVTLDGTTPTTKLTATVPAAITPGAYDVVVTNVGADPGTLPDGFTVNAATASVSLAYSASDTSQVPAGALTITATFTQSQSAAPMISIDQQGSTDITDQDMTATADNKIWTYAYTVENATGDTYKDGATTVTIKTSTGTNVTVTSGSTFTIDTLVLSATITYAQGSNTSGPFKAGGLTITVTLNTAVTDPPKISINQPGTEDITDDSSFTGSGTNWEYTYTINTKTGDTYKDGDATVSLKNTDDADADIPIGSGVTFTIDTTAPTVTLTYALGTNTTSPFKAGALTVTATFSESPASTPQIALTQQGGTNISATDMTATDSARVWTYPYTIHAATEAGYADGEATVTITNGGDAASNPNEAATNNTLTIDTSTTVTIDSVTTPTTTNTQVVTGTKESGATVAIAVTSPVTAGTVTYPTATTWQCTISSLQEQANTITATATDAAENTAQAETSITYDGTAPQVSSATYVDTTHVDVVFSEAVSGGTTAGNYSISGLTISAAADQGSNTYRLTTSEMTAGQTYTVVVSSVTDVAGNAIDVDHKSAEYVTGTKGDVNGDGSIDITDVLLTIDIIFGATPNALEFYAANVDATNEVIDITDLLGIIDIIFGT